MRVASIARHFFRLFDISQPTISMDAMSFGGEVEQALIGRNAADVGQPDPVGSVGVDVSLRLVGREAQRVPPVGGAGNATTTRRPNVVLPHDLGHRLAVDPQSLRQQLGLDARRTVAPLALLEDLADPEGKFTARCLTRRQLRGGGAPGVEPAGAERQTRDEDVVKRRARCMEPRLRGFAVH